MSSSNLIRWSGLVALVGGVLVIVTDVAEFILFGGQTFDVAVTTRAWFFLVQGLELVSFLLVLLGLIGLYARQAERTGSLGLIRLPGSHQRHSNGFRPYLV